MAMRENQVKVLEDAIGSIIAEGSEFADAASHAKSAYDTAPGMLKDCLLYTSPSPRDRTRSRMPSSA